MDIEEGGGSGVDRTVGLRFVSLMYTVTRYYTDVK